MPTQLLVCPTIVTASKLRSEAVPAAPEEEDSARLVWPDEFEEVPHTTFADLSALGLDGLWIPIGFTVVGPGGPLTVTLSLGDGGGVPEVQVHDRDARDLDQDEPLLAVIPKA